MKNNISGLWKVNTVQFLHELASNPQLSQAVTPIQILQGVLGEVALRASELNDPKLNTLMMRLALYAVSDPTQPEYDPKFTNDYIKKNGK